MTALGQNEMRPSDGMPWSVQLTEGLGRNSRNWHAPEAYMWRSVWTVDQALR